MTQPQQGYQAQPLPPQQTNAQPYEPDISQPLYGANPVQALSRFFRKYVQFRGRASRSEYWWMVMWMTIVSFVFGFVNMFTLASGISSVSSIITWLSSIVVLGTILPMLALTIRRYHDSNHSWAWFLIPILTGVVALGSVFVGFIRLFAGMTMADFNQLGVLLTSEYGGYVMTEIMNTIAGPMVFSMLLTFAGSIFNIVFALLPSKLEAVRFDNPHLPWNQTVVHPDLVGQMVLQQNQPVAPQNVQPQYGQNPYAQQPPMSAPVYQAPLPPQTAQQPQQFPQDPQQPQQ